MATTDLDRMLADGLHRRAQDGPPVDPALILRAATARGRRIRTRRRVATVILAGVAVTGLTATAVLGQRSPDTPLRQPAPTGSVYDTGDVGRMPAAPGVPGAATDPAVVGSDPAVLHFSVDDLARDAEMATYRSAAGFEVVSISSRNPRYVVDVVLARTEKDLARGFFDEPGGPAPVTIGGVPGTLRQSKVYPTGNRDYWFHWQPVPGLWAGLRTETRSADDIAGLLPAIRLDQARRCAMPFRLGRLPAGTRMRSCEVTLSSGNDGLFRDGQVQFGDGGRTVSVGASNFPGGDYARPLKAGPYRVFADPDGRSWTMKTDGIFFDLLSSRKPGYSRADALSMIGSIVMADKDDPATW